MRLPVQITFRNMESSQALDQHIRQHVEKLNQFFSRTISCRVTVELSQRQHRKGKQYRIGIDLKVPGHEFSVSNDPAHHPTNEDPYLAVNQTFNVAARLLEDHARKIRGDVKTHAG